MKDFFPMLAQEWTKAELVDWKFVVTSEYFWNKKYFAERKYDGARYILARDEDWKARLTSRTISVKTNTPVDKSENLYWYLYENSEKLSWTVLDGEILIKDRMWNYINANGSSEVNKLMLSKPEKCKAMLENPEEFLAGWKLVYVVFDILYLYWRDLTNLTIEHRKQIIEEAMIAVDTEFQNKFASRYELSIPFAATQESYENSLAAWFEGIVLKRMGSLYYEGQRTKDWVKVKKQETFDGVVMWGLRGTGKYANTLGALVIGQYFKSEGAEEFKEVCTISGMTDKQRNNYRERLRNGADRGTAYTDEKGNIYFEPWYLEDSLVVEFVAQERTSSGYRHLRFLQERKDKNHNECVF